MTVLHLANSITETPSSFITIIHKSKMCNKKRKRLLLNSIYYVYISYMHYLLADLIEPDGREIETNITNRAWYIYK